MKNIIEKEIERRETLIAEKAEKENRAIELQIELEKITLEIASTDESALIAEIEELKTYLPKPEEEPVYHDNVESEPTTFM